MSDFYKPLEAFRDYCFQKRDAKGVEACNNMMDTLDRDPRVFILSAEESRELLKYFLSAGYISREFHQPIHDIVDRLMAFLKVRVSK